jgi:hypothetical protein
MRRSAIVVLAIAVMGAVAFCCWNIIAPQVNPVEYHKREWHETLKRITGKRSSQNARSGMLWQVLSRFLRAEVSDHERLKEHEAALTKLGYLTNHQFFVTNQVLTREFSSNFFQRLFQTFGTNGEAIWSCRYSSNSHRQGFEALLPAKNVAEWERLFREYAARYASNIPPAGITDSAK